MPTPGKKTAVCSDMAWKITIDWFDRLGVHDLGNGLVARIELIADSCADHYAGFHLSIISKTYGPIDSHYFDFGDYLDKKNCDKIPSGAVYEGNLYIDREFEWYIFTPRDTRPYCAAIERYIDYYRTSKGKRPRSGK